MYGQSEIRDLSVNLVNFRYQSAIIKANKTAGEIEWIFAEPSGWGAELQEKLLKIPEEGWNWHQHSPRFLANGNLIFLQAIVRSYRKNISTK
jgi:hypothetical protein